MADSLSENERIEVSYQDIADAEQRRLDLAEEEARALEELAQKQKELNATMGDHFVAAVDNAEAMVTYNEQLGTSVTNQEAVNQAIFEAADASGASATQLAILGGALGLYSEEAVQAALQTALIQAKIDELAQAYVDGQIGVQGMQHEIQNFISELGGVAGAAGEAAAAVEGIERDVTVNVGFNVGDMPNLPGGGGGSSGDFGGGGDPQTMQTGGIVPGHFSQPVPILAHGSEMVLNPTQQGRLFDMLNGRGGGAGMGQGTVIQIILQGVKGENVAAKAQQGVLGAMRQLGQY
jgi:hypothetical protein